MKRIMMVLVILMMAASLVFATGRSQSSGSTTGGAPAKIVVEVFDRGSDGGRTLANDNNYTKWIHDKVLKDLNIDVTFFPVGRWQETQDIVNLLASGTAPDLCITYATDAISTFAQQGGILELSPYIDRLLPDYKKLLGKDPALGGDLIYRDKNAVEANKIYSLVTYVIDVRLAQKNIFIRKDWLDKLGTAIPKTTQQFHDALVAFKNRDPGGVGANNVIPFGQDYDARWGFSPIVYAYFDPKISPRDEWIYNITDRPISMPGYKEGLRLINQWYNEGLIYRDFPLLTSGRVEDYYSLLKTGRVGAFAGNWDLPYRTDYRIQEELAKNVPGAQFIAIDCIQSSDGINHKFISDKPDRRVFVPAASKNPEAALMYLNWLAKYENFNFLQIGNEGVTHEMVNGIPRTISATGPWIMNSGNNIDLTMPVNGVELLDNDKNSRVLALGYGSTPQDLIVNALATSTANGKVFTVYVAPETKVGIYGPTLRDKADALITQAVTAPVANFDRVWDAGYNDWLASGGKEIIDEKTALARNNPAWR